MSAAELAEGPHPPTTSVTDAVPATACPDTIRNDADDRARLEAVESIVDQDHLGARREAEASNKEILEEAMASMGSGT